MSLSNPAFMVYCLPHFLLHRPSNRVEYGTRATSKQANIKRDYGCRCRFIPCRAALLVELSALPTPTLSNFQFLLMGFRNNTLTHSLLHIRIPRRPTVELLSI
ncbi:hypothetical protein OUZ56_013290 [Daphnia magna]|uniref:Uncharacterized protein n=1 Tax=Daphnia magna TaxID=35525 RepID=A0ABQ9Z5E8_9CRUS|nr:hypothetical protein OUZ56_013290 [Daphnia magna]